MKTENTPVDRVCGNCKNCIIPREGMMKGQILCVCDDKKNPKVPHVHATQLHFHCSTNQFRCLLASYGFMRCDEH